MSCPRLLAPMRRHGLSLSASSRRCLPTLSAPSPTTPRHPHIQQRRSLSHAPNGLCDLLKISDEVADAVATNKPLVALESTIYTHGALGKDLAREHEELIRSRGGIPAIIAIVDGVPTVGVSSREIVRMIESQSATKVSRRDVSYLVGAGIAGRKMHGGTTISGTMLLARLAGIRVFGTGGLGGVHRGGENSMDVSADLTELGRTRVAVVATGCKGFLDIARTLEFLETQGCLVSTFADGRSGKIDFPGFWARDSGVKSPSVVYNEKEAAGMILAQEKLNIESGMLFANPVPAEHAIPLAEIEASISQAVAEANEKGFTGKDNTPYILGRLKELTGDRASTANMALVKNNLIRATNVARELSSLWSQSPEASKNSSSSSFHIASKAAPVSEPKPAPEIAVDSPTDVLVAGSVAVDLSCDFTGSKKDQVSPQLHTSNPAAIGQSIGGVGHNVALAALRANGNKRVQLCSLVGDDLAGSTVLSSLKEEGLDTTYIRRLGHEFQPANRTAQYVAVNDAEKNLVMAMADMNIFSSHTFSDYWNSTLQATKPKWLVVDGNWGPGDITSWTQAGKEHGCKVAFEPVSVEKSMRLFPPIGKGAASRSVFPRASVDLASPNQYELSAMYAEAKDKGYLDTTEWFSVIDSFGMRGARERFVYLTNRDVTDAGIPVQMVNLLPYIPTIVTKLGSEGVLLASILEKDDPRLFAPETQEYILARAVNHPTVGGVYMRLFPPAEKVEDVVSVNGVGDTFLGVLISGLAKGANVERLVHVAQQGAVMSLRCAEPVSPHLSELEESISQALR